MSPKVPSTDPVRGGAQPVSAKAPKGNSHVGSAGEKRNRQQQSGNGRDGKTDTREGAVAPPGPASRSDSKPPAVVPGSPRLPPLKFRWKRASWLLLIAAMLIGGAFYLIDQLDADRRKADPPPQVSNANIDGIPRGDDANPNARYRLRSAEKLATPHTVNFTAMGLPCESATRDDDPTNACVPRWHRCFRVVQDDFLSDEASREVLQAMEGILSTYGRGGGSGPVSLVDLNLGIVSIRDRFLSFHHALQRDPTTAAAADLSTRSVETYHRLVRKLHNLVSETIFCPSLPCASDRDRELARRVGRETLFVASPSFFSRIGGPNTPKTVNDEYWHTHVDRDQYGDFAITALLYLNTMKDPVDLITFEGGQFEFGGAYPATVEPRKARLSLFTSGSEHPHWVGPVYDGLRLALTTAFTCVKSERSFRIDGDGEGTFLHKLRAAMG